MIINIIQKQTKKARQRKEWGVVLLGLGGMGGLGALEKN